MVIQMAKRTSKTYDTENGTAKMVVFDDDGESIMDTIEIDVGDFSALADRLVLYAVMKKAGDAFTSASAPGKDGTVIDGIHAANDVIKSLLEGKWIEKVAGIGRTGLTVEALAMYFADEGGMDEADAKAEAKKTWDAADKDQRKDLADTGEIMAHAETIRAGRNAAKVASAPSISDLLG